MAADDNFDHAVLGERGDLHDEDFAGRGVEARLLPGVRAGGEVGGVAGVGVPVYVISEAGTPVDSRLT